MASSKYKGLLNSKQKKTPVWFYLVPVIIPVLFFIMLEFILRFTGYGFNNEQWIPITPEYPDKLTLNHEIGYRYFYSTKNIPYSIQDVFDKEKKENAFRVFILGESSAAGFPFSPNGSFSRYISERLKLIYPDKIIEVVNTGMAAINTYTIKDILPGILKQKPDLILIYTGHNEYYGALGVGSSESLGGSEFVVNSMLWLNQFKVTQLIRNFITWIGKLFTNQDENISGETLMSRMAEDQSIIFDSPSYHKGIKQFRNNMETILSRIKEQNIPVIIGTLTSNLKDQPPFISIKTDKYLPAIEVYEEAELILKDGDTSSAKELFIKAKELDALRFRAPEDINHWIQKFAYDFEIPIIEIDSYFNGISPYGITGNNLMTDHLHPTLEGYHIIGKLFFDEMIKQNFLPDKPETNLSIEEQDSIVVNNFPFSDLDRRIAAYRIEVLMNNWPYKDRSGEIDIKPANYIDSIAVKVVTDKITWERGHLDAASYHLTNQNYNGFIEEMNALIGQYPFIRSYYERTAIKLMNEKQFESSLPYLHKMYDLKKDPFSSKWLGIIYLSKKEAKEAIIFLEESIRFDNSDPQTFYNLSGAYIENNEYQKALDAINRCLQIDPQFPDAKRLQQQLRQIVM